MKYILDNKKKLFRALAYIGVFIAIIGLSATLYSSKIQKTYKYSDIVGYFKNQQVTEYDLNLSSGKMTMKLKDGTTVNYEAPSALLLYNDIGDYIKEYNKNNPDKTMTYNMTANKDRSWMNTILSVVLMVALTGALYWFLIRKMLPGTGDISKQMGFGKAKAADMNSDKNKTTFDDVAGADEEKAELTEIVEFLRNPSKYNELGARIPKGVLLVGPPGTGKTLLARAVAGEANAPFFSMSGSDFVEMYAGVGASRVRDLFAQAKKNTPCIVFIDEIDAVGRQRENGRGGAHDEREQTLNQLLVELDGFGVNEGVILIAATNRPDILDPALMRPGRFDRQVAIGYPDMKGREDILKVHSKGKPLAPDVELSTIAKSTVGFTGADLENLLNEAALLAARKDLKAITKDEIEEATIKVVVGTEKKSKTVNEHEKKLTAYHEAGHAVVSYFCETQDSVHQISIIPRGTAGGYTMHLPTEDRDYHSRRYMYEGMMVSLGGRVAEKLILDDISTGAYGDINNLSSIARSMVMKYGMSEKLGPISYSTNDDWFVKPYSEQTAYEIDKEVQSIVDRAYKQTEEILKEHINKLHQVAQYLLKNEKMDGEDFIAMMKSEEAKKTEE